MNKVKKAFKWIGISLGSLLVMVLAVYLFVYISTERRFNTAYQVEAKKLVIPTDSASYTQGAPLSIIKGCQDCHGPNLAGRVFIDDPALGRIVAANLTQGKGGLPANFSDADWVRAIKHGVDQQGKPLKIMPAEEFNSLTDRDLSALIAYCKSQPPVDNELPNHQLMPLARILTALDKVPMITAEKIDHSQQQVIEVKTQVSAEYGKYLAVACTGCHRPNFQGGEPIAPGFPTVADITPNGHPGKWTEEDFIHTLRTGKTPEGKTLNNEDMPWKMTKEYTDDELKSIWLFLNTQGNNSQASR